jgi:hypothetical protein
MSGHFCLIVRWAHQDGNRGVLKQRESPFPYNHPDSLLAGEVRIDKYMQWDVNGLVCSRFCLFVCFSSSFLLVAYQGGSTGIVSICIVGLFGW